MSYTQVVNNFESAIADVGGIDAAATTLTLTAGDGAGLPASGDFVLTLGDKDTAGEIIKVTSRSGDVLTIERGQEDTVASIWAEGTVVTCRLTAGVVEELQTALAAAESDIDVLEGGAFSGDVEVAGELEINGGEVVINNVPATGNALAVLGSSWVIARLETTGENTDSAILFVTPGFEWQLRVDGSDNDKFKLRNGNGLDYWTVSTAGNMYIRGDCSAASFTDRSPVYVGGRALEILRGVQAEPDSVDPEGWAKVDHETIGPMLRAAQKKAANAPSPASEKGKRSPVANESAEVLGEEGKKQEGPGRDICKNIQLNSAAVLELLARVEALEARVVELEAR